MGLLGGPEAVAEGAVVVDVGLEGEAGAAEGVRGEALAALAPDQGLALGGEAG